jgi:hypothetical protein
MSKYGRSLGGAKVAIPVPRIRGSHHVNRQKKMKLSIKQRIRNWLLDDNEPDQIYSSQEVESAQLESTGMRFNLYKASGGFVIETRHYDERNDRNINKMYVINEDKDLGAELGKIITMESLR